MDFNIFCVYVYKRKYLCANCVNQHCGFKQSIQSSFYGQQDILMLVLLNFNMSWKMKYNFTINAIQPFEIEMIFIAGLYSSLSTFTFECSLFVIFPKQTICLCNIASTEMNCCTWYTALPCCGRCVWQKGN